MQNSKKFEINPTNEFHILRHFEFVKEAYKKTLINKPYWCYDYSQEKFIAARISKDDIQHALETIGTKFYKNVPGIENPKKLLELIKEKFTALESNNKVRWANENKCFAFTFKYDAPVGNRNALSINDLSDHNRKNIKSVLRSKCVGENNIMVNTITGIELRSSDMIYVEMIKTEQFPFFVITAFPKCLTSDIPNDELVFVT